MYNFRYQKATPLLERLDVFEIEERMMYNTYNMGLGMIVAVNPADVEKAMEAMRAAGEAPYAVGSIEEGEKGVSLC